MKDVRERNAKYTDDEICATQRSMLEVGWSGLTEQEKAILKWRDFYCSWIAEVTEDESNLLTNTE